MARLIRDKNDTDDIVILQLFIVPKTRFRKCHCITFFYFLISQRPIITNTVKFTSFTGSVLAEEPEPEDQRRILSSEPLAPNIKFSTGGLTHHQTTNFRLFQTERVCRRQFQIWRKWQKVIKTGRKHCGKRRNFSFSHSVFKRLVSQGRQKASLCGNGLSNI